MKTNRTSYRFEFEAPVRYETDDDDGTGKLVDVSRGGFELTDCSMTLAPGAKATIRIEMLGEAALGVRDFEVVRQTDTGFAARFASELDEEQELDLVMRCAAACRAARGASK